MINKQVNNIKEAVKGVKSGMTIMFGGFGLCGIPENSILQFSKMEIFSLTCISNNAGIDDFGLGLLLKRRQIKKINYNNIEVISDEKIKSHILSKSIFAVAKSGTVSLEICQAKVPSIIIYKMNFLNYLIVKMLVKVKYANIINIINDEEVIPELIQNECNPKEIFNSVVYLLKNPELMKKQMNICQKTISDIRNNGLSSSNAANIIADYIKN